MCFTRFREKRNGPYDLFIDAANVAFFGQNYAGEASTGVRSSAWLKKWTRHIQIRSYSW
jgi:hypothetical protein